VNGAHNEVSGASSVISVSFRITDQSAPAASSDAARHEGTASAAAATTGSHGEPTQFSGR